MKVCDRLPAERIAVAGAVATAALLDEPHLHLLSVRGSALGTLWEQNQGFLGVTGGYCWTLPVTPNLGPDLQVRHRIRLEAATGIEPVYRALQALA